MHVVDEFTVEWGDCDEAGIVFYPNYFRWFDAGFQKLLRARDLDQRRLRARYGVVGTPIVDASATFLGTATHGDRLSLEAAVVAFGRSSFTVSYRLNKGADTIVDGLEVRVFARSDEDGRLQKTDIPQAFRTALA